MRNMIWTFLILAAALYALLPKTYTATAQFAGDVEISLSLRPMFGWHSDWYRRLHVISPAISSTHDLFGDTGWWRGSNLYLHSSGSFILHEGQAGCLVFDALPSMNRPKPVVTCKKTVGKPRPWPSVDKLPQGAMPSALFDDLAYLGHFAEGGGEDPPLRFIPAADGPEPELPDPL